MTPQNQAPVGRNEKCPCGSGRKYKQCCLRKDEEKTREVREKAEQKAAREAEKAAKSGEGADEKEGAASDTSTQAMPRKPQTHQPWKKSATNTHAFHKVSTPRKVGGG